MTPENPEVTRFIELLESEDYDPREPTPMELAQAHREYCASQGVWLLTHEQMEDWVDKMEKQYMRD
jgi:hypothetical protein